MPPWAGKSMRTSALLWPGRSQFVPGRWYTVSDDIARNIFVHFPEIFSGLLATFIILGEDIKKLWPKILFHSVLSIGIGMIYNNFDAIVRYNFSQPFIDSDFTQMDIQARLVVGTQNICHILVARDIHKHNLSSDNDFLIRFICCPDCRGQISLVSSYVAIFRVLIG